MRREHEQAPGSAWPTDVGSLADLLLLRGQNTATGFGFIDSEGVYSEFSFAALTSAARCVAAGLQGAGLSQGSRLLLQLHETQHVIIAFWGCVLAGVVPVCLNCAPSYNSANSQLDKCNGVVDDFELSSILTSRSLLDSVTSLESLAAKTDVKVLTIEALSASSDTFEKPALIATDTAAMFLTSGSTGTPKGVPQSHRTMLSMAAGTAAMNGFSDNDVSLNWMSMDHAGALVFLGITPLLVGARQIHVPIDYILKQLLRWLELIDRYAATISWAPNFVFSLLLSKESLIKRAGWNLQTMRFMVNAGEPVVASTARQFICLMQQLGLPEGALRPAFGMVETCSGITWSSGFRLADTSDDDQFVSLGKPIAGAAISIVDDSGEPVTEEREGRLRIRGESVFDGYFNRPELNNEVIQEGWFETGDLAFIKDGELFVTGRSKDVLIVNGTNYYCHDIESSAGEVAAVQASSVAAIGIPTGNGSTEQLVILYAVRSGASVDCREDIERDLAGKIFSHCGLACAAFVKLDEEEFPRTGIGKIQRSVLRERFLAGEFDGRVSGLLAGARRKDVAPPYEEQAELRATSELMESIRQIWCQCLGIDSLRVDDVFFEVGGSSLTAIQIQAELELLVGRPISMAELFDTPTVRLMAEYFGGVRDTKRSAPQRRDRASAQADIAVIGIGCRFPGAQGPGEFWKVLEAGEETITRFTAEQAIAAGLSESAARHPDQVNAAPILDDVEGCDLDFWKFSQREATLIDPQQRVFLETAWEAFEDAGYRPGAHLGRVGVYASAATNTYQQNNLYANRNWVAQNGGSMLTVDSYDGFNVMTSNDKDYLPTRVSFKLDLVGPSISIQTACSSTLVAVHEAVKSLRLGESDMAVAGGCALMLPQHAGHLYVEGMINSPDGHCRAYDAMAKGTIFGSGSGAVILKRLEDALDDGDHIYAVIKGSGVANDGAQKMGYAAPSMAGEARAIEQALQDSGIEPNTIGFVEGHGTGTPIGDPIEVQALTKAFGEPIDAENHCALGSVKTNIGHMGIASGIAGFIKTALALHHKKLPATVHFKEANPAIGIENTPFYVSSKTTVWQSSGPRRAGVNSLGIGGTNVHVILEEAPVRPAESSSDPVAPYLLPLSAHSPEALDDLTQRLYAYVRENPDIELEHLCHTYQTGRTPFLIRRAIAFRDREELLTVLRELKAPVQPSPGNNQIVFMFTGQGAQYLAMARELIEKNSLFRQCLVDACALFEGTREVSIEQLLMQSDSVESAEDLLQQTAYTQVALFCLQVALVQFYRTCGVQPGAVIGHSVGEITAVWAAGGLSLEDAAKLVEIRSRIMQGVAEAGAMAAVSGSYAEVTTALFGNDLNVELAAVNSDTEFTISCTPETMVRTQSVLDAVGLRVKPLAVSHAFHSTHFATIQAVFKEAIANIDYKPVLLPCFRNLDGQNFMQCEHDSQYWVDQVCSPVLFREGIKACFDAEFTTFLEIGPQPILCGFGRNNDAEDQAKWLPSLRRGQSDLMQVYRSLAALYESGQSLTWSEAAGFGGRRINGLPTYPWQRTRCWVSPDRGEALNEKTTGLTTGVVNLPGRQRIYAQTFSSSTHAEIDEHRVFGRPVPPAAMWISWCLETALEYWSNDAVVLSDIHFLSPMPLANNEAREVHISYRRHDQGASVELYSVPTDPAVADGDTQVHMIAELKSVNSTTQAVNIRDIMARASGTVAPSMIQNHMLGMGLELGPRFQWLDSIWVGDGEALAQLRDPSNLLDQTVVSLSAGLIDSHWQSALVAGELPDQTVVPARIESVEVFAPIDRIPRYVHATRRDAGDVIVADVTLLNRSGECLLVTSGLQLQRISPELFGAVLKEVMSLARQHSAVNIAAAEGVERQVHVDGETSVVEQLITQLSQLAVPGLQLMTKPGELSQGDVHALRCIDISVSPDLPTLLHEITSWISQYLASGVSISSLQILLITGRTPETQARSADTVEALNALVKSLARENPGVAVSALELPDVDPDSLWGIGHFLMRAILGNENLRWINGQWHAASFTDLALADVRKDFSSDRWQVITGGLGGVGLATARWMLEAGARRFALLSRSKPSIEVDHQLESLRQAGAEIVLPQLDVLDAAGLRRLAEQLNSKGGVETVVHAAGLVHDGLAMSLTAEAFTTVVRTKYDGAKNLCEAFSQKNPVQMIFYSSTAAWFGSEGQSNYAAANGALDGLTDIAAHQGQSIVSVAWGPWEDLGMTARLSSSQCDHIAGRGYGFLSSTEAFDQLSRFLGTVQLEQAQAEKGIVSDMPASRVISIVKIDPLALNTVFRPTALVSSEPEQGESAVKSASKLAEVLLANGVAAAESFLQTTISKAVVELTSLRDQDDIDLDAGLLDMGVDSLAGLELRKRLETETGLKLKSTLILDYPSIRSMAKELVQRKATALDVSTVALDDDGGNAVSTDDMSETDLLLDELAREISGVDR